MKQVVDTDLSKKETIFFEEVNCDFCGKAPHRKIFSLKDNLTNYKENLNLVECLNCSLVYINPRPTEQSLSLFYLNNFHAQIFLYFLSLLYKLRDLP